MKLRKGADVFLDWEVDLIGPSEAEPNQFDWYRNGRHIGGGYFKTRDSAYKRMLYELASDRESVFIANQMAAEAKRGSRT